jgi:hypothetical protein
MEMPKQNYNHYYYLDGANILWENQNEPTTILLEKLLFG